MTALLEVRNLHVAYGKVEAVHDISLTVQPGTIVTVIGPNGAGKTTLLAALMGLLPARGDIRYLGVPATGLSVEERVARGLLLVPERRELFAMMSVADNLQLGAFSRVRRGDRRWRETLDEVYQRFPRLLERRTQLAGTLSGGERQMLAMGRALMGKPTLLLLDEPSLGLAPLIVREIFRIISALRETGVAILLVEQNARAALDVADYGYVLETGELAVEGDSRDLAANPQVAATYLGKGMAARAGETGATIAPSGSDRAGPPVAPA
jgi:branched-chain amino acid transport system ATP-binding protein